MDSNTIMNSQFNQITPILSLTLFLISPLLNDIMNIILPSTKPSTKRDELGENVKERREK